MRTPEQRRASRSHTKSGPGRYHGNGAMFITPSGERVTRDPSRRLPVANFGGNWQGAEYYSYREHDRIRLMQLSGQATRSEAIAAVQAARRVKS